MRSASTPALFMVCLLAACEHEPTQPVRTPVPQSPSANILTQSDWLRVSLPFSPTAINDAGVIVGSKNGEAVRWENGTLTVLPRRADVGGAYKASGISNSGLIVGEASNHGLMWVIPSLSPTDISVDEYGGFKALSPKAINDHFVVVGHQSSPTWNPFRYSPTKGVKNILPMDVGSATATGLSNDGFASGFALPWSGPVMAVRWDTLGKATLLPSPYPSAAYGINNANEIIGTSNGAALWRLTGPPVFFSALPSSVSCVATGISDVGRIIGYSCSPPSMRSWTYFQGVLTWLDAPEGTAVIVVDVNTCGSIVGGVVGPGGTDAGYLWIRGGIVARCDAPLVKTSR